MVPFLPQNVILQSGNGANFLLWDIAAGATSYSIQRSTDGVNFTTIGTASTNNYLDSSVTVGTNYFYQVASTNTSGTSSYNPSFPTNITPCLPGQINLGYLRYMSQLRADKLNSYYLTTDEWNWNIRQSANVLYNILITHWGEDYFFAPRLSINLTGQDFYDLPNGGNYQNTDGSFPPALFKLNGVDANINGVVTGPNAGWVPLARFNWIDRDKYTTYPAQAGALNNIYQMAYRMMGSQIEIIPQNINQYIRLNYVPILKDMLKDTDMLPFSISGYSEFIINDAAKKAMIKEESLEKWNALTQANAAIVQMIEESASNRDSGQPNSVSNTRANVGDPGFSNWGNGWGSGGWGGGMF